METFIIAVVLFVVVLTAITIICTSARFESSKSIEFRRLEAERERKWLDYWMGPTWYDRHKQ
jgi:hypothetical protein